VSPTASIATSPTREVSSFRVDGRVAAGDPCWDEEETVRTEWLLTLALALCGAAACDDDGTTDDTDDTDTEDSDSDTDLPCPTSGTSGERVECIVALDGDPVAGATFYDNNCQLCHCDDGVGGCSLSYPPAADLTASVLTEQNVVAFVLAGSEGTDMDSYAAYQNQDLANVTTYVMETFITP
jgi:hypothetical protein